MGILQGSKADFLQPQVGLNTTLDDQFDVSSGTLLAIPDLSVNLTLPGTYQLTCTLMTIIEVSSAPQGMIVGGFFKNNLSNLFITSTTGIGLATQLNVSTFNSGTLITLVTITEPTLIGVFAQAQTFGAGTAVFTTANVFADGVASRRGQLQAIQLIN